MAIFACLKAIHDTASLSLILWAIAPNDLFGVSLHSVGFSRAGRSIYEDSAILAVQKSIAKRLTLAFFEHICLSRILVQDFFKPEHFLFVWIRHSTALDSPVKHDFLVLPGLFLILNYFEADRMLPFGGNQRPNASNYLNWHLLSLRLCQVSLEISCKAIKGELVVASVGVRGT